MKHERPGTERHSIAVHCYLARVPCCRFCEIVVAFARLREFGILSAGNASTGRRSYAINRFGELIRQSYRSRSMLIAWIWVFLSFSLAGDDSRGANSI